MFTKLFTVLYFLLGLNVDLTDINDSVTNLTISFVNPLSLLLC